jgi:hypothetical protein
MLNMSVMWQETRHTLLPKQVIALKQRHTAEAALLHSWGDSEMAAQKVDEGCQRWERITSRSVICHRPFFACFR